MTAPAPILFGKLPTHGDFLSRGLSTAAREGWDAWAAEAIALAREVLREDFDAAHEAAPPWRFVIGPGRFGPAWRAGAVAASIDSAGRRYVVVAAADGLEVDVAQTTGRTIAEAAEDLIYSAFEGGWTAERTIEEAQQRLQVADSLDPAAPVEGWWTEGGPEHPPRTAPSEPADQVLTFMFSLGRSEEAPP